VLRAVQHHPIIAIITHATKGVLCHARLLAGQNGEQLQHTALKLDKARRTYYRRYKVPAIKGTTAKACARCNEWFAASPRERICFGCSPARERVKRSLHAVTPGRANERTERQVRGRALSDSLAREALPGIEFPELRKLRHVTVLTEPVKAARRCPLTTLTDPVLTRAHRRAVSEGRQGCVCREVVNA
jgi:hypothetical protein